jgi:TRAP-type uncharacterized transport system, periplasmic component
MNRPLFAGLLFLVGLCGLTPVMAEDTDAKQIGMVTGSKTGTYIQFGNDIAGVAKTVGLDILVKDSQGSIDNIKRINSKENATFGIVQSDVLGFLSRSESPEMRQVASRLRLIFPFYNEEVHLFASKSIQSFNDLQGKRVVVGEQGSGTWLTAMNLLQLTGVKPVELLNMPPLQGVTAVLEGGGRRHLLRRRQARQPVHQGRQSDHQAGVCAAAGERAFRAAGRPAHAA